MIRGNYYLVVLVFHDESDYYKDNLKYFLFDNELIADDFMSKQIHSHRYYKIILGKPYPNFPCLTEIE